MDFVFRDLRLAGRRLRRNPAFTTVAVTTLALGIGAATTVFSVVYGVLLRPLPFPNADRFVRVVQTIEMNGAPGRAGLSPDQFANLQDHATTLEAVGTWAHADRTLTGTGTPVRLNGAAVSVPLFSALGIGPASGRLFDAEDSVPGADPVVVLSERTWRRYFGGDLRILDSRVLLGGVATRVIGVMPGAFTFPPLEGASPGRDSIGQLTEVPEFWIPARPFSRAGPSPGFSMLQAYAVLARGVRLERAEAEVRSVAGPLPDGRAVPIELASARDEMGLPARRLLLIFQAGVTLILLIAGVNVANLLLARASARRHEVAIRVALGAGRGRIVRDGMAESLILALAGGVLGCGLAYLLTTALQLLPPHVLPRLRDIRVDTAVVLFAIAISVCTGLAIGLLAVMRAGRADPSRWLHVRGRAVLPSHRRLRPSSALVVLQVAAAMVLLTASGLLVNSFVRLLRVDLGYEPAGVLTFQIELPRSRYGAPDARARFFDGLTTSLGNMPGVESVAAESPGGIGFDPLVIDGRPSGRAVIRFRPVTAGYFDTLRLPVRQGREFTASDTAGVIVNEAFVRRFLGDEAALGRRIEWGTRFAPSEILGVVADSRQTFDGAEEPLIYLPSDLASGITGLRVFVRASSGGAAVMGAAREAIGRLDPELAMYNAASLDEALSLDSAASRFHTLLSMACAVLALLLAAVGLYGLLAYSVSAGWHETAVRVALGASGRHVLLRVMGHGLLLTAAGVVLGLAGSYAATQALSAMLFGVDPRDGVTFAGTAILFVMVAALACYLPARRAARVDPALALRAE